MSECPCGSNRAFDECCAPLLNGEAPAETAEALMRSRYSAYVKHNIAYLGETLHPSHRHDWDEAATRIWSQNAVWKGLEIVSTEAGSAQDEAGVVEFIAHYEENGKLTNHHEISQFSKQGGRWYYVDGTAPKPKTMRHQQPKVGRNDPCPCGSGKKYKKCCGA